MVVIETLRRELVGLLVPPLCLACREPEFERAALCPTCRARLVALGASRCGRCGAPLGSPAARCGECRVRRLAFDRAWAPFAYEGTARQLVAALKSRAHVEASRLIASEIASRAPPGLLGPLLVPVPAHAARRRCRGFNHATAIARALGRCAGVPVAELLVRRAPSAPQVGLERRARLANANGSVALRSGAAAPERALLVDDVYTTGATLDACAQALKRAGCPAVGAITFARAIRD